MQIMVLNRGTLIVMTVHKQSCHNRSSLHGYLTVVFLANIQERKHKTTEQLALKTPPLLTIQQVRDRPELTQSGFAGLILLYTVLYLHLHQAVVMEVLLPLNKEPTFML